MARGRGRKARDPWAALPSEFRDAVMQGSEEELHKKLVETTLAQQALLDAKQKDEDYQRAKTAFGVAGAVYREGTKVNGLKVKFIKQTLEGRGRL